jgi:uncharacterized FAD-dependent dehydrogenase
MLLLKSKGGFIYFWRLSLSEDKYDVIIVGTGPGGIFSAMEILKKNPQLRLLILEKGNAIGQRKCPRLNGSCLECRSCAITAGWGGAGAFSDGKLTYAAEVGGWLADIIGGDELLSLYPIVDAEWMHFAEQHDDTYYDFLDEELKAKCQRAGIRLIHEKVRHLGTDRCLEILNNMYAYISSFPNVTILHRATAESILTDESKKASGIEFSYKRELVRAKAPLVVVAPGRVGSEWLQKEMERLGIPLKINPIDIGVRVETSAVWADALTANVYEPKMVYYTEKFDDKVRTFCVNPRGQVVTESYGDVITVNGHSNFNSKTENTNFALLVSTIFTDPFREPTKYGKHIARLANMIGGGAIVQRLGDLKRGRRSTPESIARGTVRPTLDATPGDLSFVLPYRYLVDIVEMLDRMDEVAPGVGSKDTLLYGVEVKFYSSRPQLDEHFETPVPGLYAIGDGAGVTRGLSQASANGIVVGRAINRKLGKTRQSNK